MKKILISVAPVPHTGTAIPQGPATPVTPEEVAAATIECAKAGAAMVHLHVRDQYAEQTADLFHFSKTLDLIRSQSDIVIQGSTGGVADLSLEDRCVSLDDPRTETASLNMGSSNSGNGVYINTIPDIRFWATKMQERQIIPELECFDLSMIETVIKLAEEGLIPKPLGFNFCFGYEGSLSSNHDYLFTLKNALPAGSHWGIIHRGMKDLRFVAAAAALGASSISVGYEYSYQYAAGRLAATNAEMVQRLVDLLAMMDITTMSPAEARSFMGVPDKKNVPVTDLK